MPVDKKLCQLVSSGEVILHDLRLFFECWPCTLEPAPEITTCSRIYAANAAFRLCDRADHCRLHLTDLCFSRSRPGLKLSKFHDAQPALARNHLQQGVHAELPHLRLPPFSLACDFSEDGSEGSVFSPKTKRYQGHASSLPKREHAEYCD